MFLKPTTRVRVLLAAYNNNFGAQPAPLEDAWETVTGQRKQGSVPGRYLVLCISYLHFTDLSYGMALLRTCVNSSEGLGSAWSGDDLLQ